MAKTSFDDLLKQYNDTLLSLNRGDYKQSIKGFNLLINQGIEHQKSVSGLCTAYLCLTEYTLALKVYDKYPEVFTDAENTGYFIGLSTNLLMKETALLKKNFRGYFSRFLTAKKIKYTETAYIQNPDNIVAIVILNYLYSVLGIRPMDSSSMMKKFVYNEYLDDEFRWRLTEKLSVSDPDLSDDIVLASRFKKISRFLNHDYINMLLFASLVSDNLNDAREKIEVQRMNGVDLSEQVMWNYIELSVKNNEIDDLSVNFAKRLFQKGWMDADILQVLKYAKDNLNIYNVQNELKSMELFGI